MWGSEANIDPRQEKQNKTDIIDGANATGWRF